MTADLIVWILTGILGLWLGSMELRMRTQESELSRLRSKLRGVEVMTEEVRNDLNYIKTRLDTLIERLISQK